MIQAKRASSRIGAKIEWILLAPGYIACTKIVLIPTDDFLLKYVDVRGLSPVNPRHHENVLTWMINNRPLLVGEDNFIFSIDDFVTARKRSEPGPSRLADSLESWIAKDSNSRLHVWRSIYLKAAKDTNH